MGKGRTLENTYISCLCNGPHDTYLSLVMFWFYCCYLSFWVVLGGNGEWEKLTFIECLLCIRHSVKLFLNIYCLIVSQQPYGVCSTFIILRI